MTEVTALTNVGQHHEKSKENSPQLGNYERAAFMRVDRQRSQSAVPLLLICDKEAVTVVCREGGSNRGGAGARWRSLIECVDEGGT